jgi:signal transduction histidine kinase/CheY-like chemotaxis protein
VHVCRSVAEDTHALRAERALVIAALVGLGLAVTVDAWSFLTERVSVGWVPFAFALQALGVGTASRLEHSRAEQLARQQAAELVEHNQRLDSALAEAEQARETRARFTANVSHELRTPVNGVVGLSSLLADTPLDSRQRELVDHLMASARAMRGLVDDVLDFARIDAGHIEPSPAWHDTRTLVCEVLATLAHAAYEKGLGLEARAERGVPLEVHIDGFRLRQVLLNLVGNAVKFTEGGAVTVRVNVGATLTGTEMIIEVKDTGQGIDPAKMRDLFEPFIQGDDSATRVFGGSGLGLAISRELVVAMGGSIEVESERGAGSVFRVRVPVGVRSGTTLWSLPLPERTRVLVIDWDGLLRFALEPLLEGSGAEVVWRRTISDVAEDDRFDLILDGALALPQAVDACRRRSNARWIACPRLDDRVQWPRSVAPDAVLYRPLFPRRLVEVLVSQSFEPARVASRAVHESERMMLVVDDNPVNLLVACRFVERLGYPVKAARGGEEALAILDREPVDTVLMDCQMPGMDGFEATRQVRIRHGHRVRVIALTASALDADRIHAMASGMDGYLVKPVDFERLREVLALPHEPIGPDDRTEDGRRDR